MTVAGGSSALRGPVAGAGRAALSQAVSLDPLNHWKIQQGSGTGNSTRGTPGPTGATWTHGEVGRDVESQPGLLCSRGAARGQQGPHEEPGRREMRSVHLRPLG